MDMKTTSSAYHTEESQNNDTYISYFLFLEIHKHTFIYSGYGKFAYGFTDQSTLYFTHKTPIMHLLQFPVWVFVLVFFFFFFLRVVSALKDIKKSRSFLQFFPLSQSLIIVLPKT